MQIFINKLIQLADGLDGLGLQKDADKLDQIIAKIASGDDVKDMLGFEDLFDAPSSFRPEEERGPGEDKVVIEEPEIHTPLEEEEAPISVDRKNRLKLIKRRHNELMNLKDLVDKSRAMEEKEEVAVDRPDEVKLPVATPEDLKAFEDEDDEDDVAVNEADDSLIDMLKEKLKSSAPELLSQIINIVKDNPELLELLAL